MKKIFIMLIASLIITTFSSFTSYAYEIKASQLDDAMLGAKAAILLERDTGTILYEKNVHEQLAPASMTKIMTLLLVLEAIETRQLSLDEKVIVSERASSMGGSQVFLETGEEMSVEDLIKAIAIASANDASVALAERIAGSESAFVEKMNEKVAELGLKNTKFQNSSGLPADDHYTTAYDIAMIAKELLKYETIVTYTSTYEDYLRKGEENEFWLVNTNRLVRFHPYVDGLKTGYTKEAQFCLTASATKDDMRVVAVVMGAETSKERNRMVSQLIDYAFHHYETEKLFDKGDSVKTVHDFRAKNGTYTVKASEPISLLYRKLDKNELTYDTEITLHEKRKLPMKRGEEVGTLTITTQGKVLHTSPIIVDEPIEIATIPELFKRAFFHIAKMETK